MRRLSASSRPDLNSASGIHVAVCKAMLQTGIYPNFIVVEDGIGAAPLEFIDHLACQREGLRFVHNAHPV
jgi:hypothetical protein